MKKKVIAVLEDIRDEIDVNASIDSSDTLVGKMVVIDAQELEATKNNIYDVIKMIQNEIDFDDALKYVGAVPVITGDKDTDALLEDERLNQEKLVINNTCGNPSGCDDECRKNKHCPNPDECTQPFQCHIHSWEHLEFDEDCPLCTTLGKIEIPSYFKVFLNEVIQQLFNSIQCDGDRCSCQISDEYYHLNEVSDVMNKIRNYIGK